MGDGRIITPDARSQFESGIPPYKVRTSLYDLVSLRDLPFIHSPLQLFQYLETLSGPDVMKIVSQMKLGDFYKVEETPLDKCEELSRSAIQALGESNVFAIAQNLLIISKDRIGKPMNIRLSSGLKLAADLPLPQLRSVIAEFSNIARLNDDYAYAFSHLYPMLLETMSYIFGSKIFRTAEIQTQEIQIINNALQQDFSAFIQPIKNWRFAGKPDLRNTIFNFEVLRINLAKPGKFERFGNQIIPEVDTFIQAFGYR